MPEVDALRRCGLKREAESLQWAAVKNTDVARRWKEEQGGYFPEVLFPQWVAERWDEIVANLRASGRSMLASHFATALPTAVSSRGVITVQLDDHAASAFDIVQEALNMAQKDVLESIRAFFTGVEKVVLAPLSAFLLIEFPLDGNSKCNPP